MGVRCLFGVFGILLRGIGGVVGGSGRSLRSVCGRGFETRLVAHERRLLEIASILQRRRWRNIKTWEFSVGGAESVGGGEIWR